MKLLLCCVLSLTLVLVGCLFPVYANSGGGPVPYTGSNGCSCDEYSTDNVCMKWHCAYSASPESSCFPADSMVTLESGKSIPVSQLREGDRVETVFSDGTIGFDTFYTWLDVDRSKTATFLRLHLSEQDGAARSITLSPEHLLFLANEGAESVFAQEEHELTFAKKVAIGDYVWSKKGSGPNAILVASRVESISLIESVGVFAPATHSGALLVDGVLASNYAMVLLPQNILHYIGFGPLVLMDKLFGTTSPEQGIHWYASLLNQAFLQTGLLGFADSANL